ncbi:hypothetical protein [Colwellia psychrerythraea]|uniref:Uncharacterized protein n=1 Tax=Colwellia psychrerythraea TaxID=28229 RepID=A0A099KBI3_COLPS|nr:hypothetical protein [Colwellia psychrerythraea]KGJ87640.1 hypothetical protein ND2E_4378 [Colwellia psychrerythraea]
MNKKRYSEVLSKDDIAKLPEAFHRNIVLDLIHNIKKKKDIPDEWVELFKPHESKKNAEAGYSLISAFVNFVESNSKIPFELLAYFANAFRQHLDNDVDLKEALNLTGSKTNKDRIAYEIFEMVEKKSHQWEKEYGYKLPLDLKGCTHDTSIYKLVSEDLIKDGFSLSDSAVRKHHEYVRSFTNKFDKQLDQMLQQEVGE